MQLRSLTAYHVRLSLKRPFSHASYTRYDSDNVLVRCDTIDGNTGWGEGVPRDYVTGESPDTCFEQLGRAPLAEQLGGDIHSWPEVIEMCDRFRPASGRDDPRGCATNSLRCAVELSILDAFGRAVAQPLGNVTRHFPPAADLRRRSDYVRYSAAIGADPRRRLRLAALKMRLYGFNQCKVKVGVGGDDATRLRQIRRWIGPRVDLRIDANEAWTADEVGLQLEPLFPLNISCVEQPCRHAQLAQLAAVRPELPIPVMLDESLTSPADAERAIKIGACDLFNLRLSKCGGFLACLRLAAQAHAAGLAYQLGCHPGESGILSAAGRHWATSVAGIRYLEGSYDRHLFHKLLTNEDITFGYGGRGAALTSPGLGVTVNQRLLEEVTIRQATFPVL